MLDYREPRDVKILKEFLRSVARIRLLSSDDFKKTYTMVEVQHFKAHFNIQEIPDEELAKTFAR